MQEVEIWKDVVGYEGIYQISSLGSLKVLARTWRSGRKGSQIKHRDEFIMRPKPMRCGYFYFELYKEAVGAKRYAHRIVALAHIPNPLNLPCVNHKNGIKTDNRVENLEWCTHSYNVKHGFDVLNRIPTWLGKKRPYKKRTLN
jgi:hypothetical protein